VIVTSLGRVTLVVEVGRAEAAIVTLVSTLTVIIEAGRARFVMVTGSAEVLTVTVEAARAGAAMSTGLGATGIVTVTELVIVSVREFRVLGMICSVGRQLQAILILAGEARQCDGKLGIPVVTSMV
jgi:hypothetical protein